jgi:carbon storage regulator
MLLLKRLPGQSIRIGDDIVVVVIRVEGERVTLGIEAPREVAIVRDDAIRTTPKEGPCTK